MMKKIIVFFLLLFAHLFIQCNKSNQSDKYYGTMKHHNNFPSEYIEERNVDVWLPPGYEENTGKNYPVIYMHDGQNLFEDKKSYIGVSWNVHETITKLSKSNTILPAIVIGIWNTSKRINEYMPEDPLELLDRSNQTLLNTEIGEIFSNNYLKFIVQELKPFIDSSYRTSSDYKNTFIMGSSMGGLISWYALAKYPEVFGGAGCLSTHWPVGAEGYRDEVFHALKKYLKQSLPAPKNHKIYFDYGTETLDSLYEPYQVQIDSVMRELGYSEGDNWITKKFEGHEHSERSWRNRLNYPLEFMLAK